MARIRTIKPEFFRHRRLYLAEIEERMPLRVAFAGLWGCADRDGRFRWEPEELKLDCLPFDKVEFSRVLDALVTRGFVVKYEVGGRLYGSIPSFRRHQVVNNRERASALPEPPENNDLTTREARVADASGTRHDLAQVEGKGREGKGINQLPPPGAFVRFWISWPKNDRKQAKGKCLEAWRKLVLDEHAEAILAHVERLKLSDGWRRGFVPAPLVYLNQRRWEGADDASQPAELKLAI